jgi:hypothetical protein
MSVLLFAWRISVPRPTGRIFIKIYILECFVLNICTEYSILNETRKKLRVFYMTNYFYDNIAHNSYYNQKLFPGKFFRGNRNIYFMSKKFFPRNLPLIRSCGKYGTSRGATGDGIIRRKNDWVFTKVNQGKSRDNLVVFNSHRLSTAKNRQAKAPQYYILHTFPVFIKKVKNQME